MNNIKILCYGRIDVSEGIDVNRTGESKECDVCRYWYFLSKGFQFQSYVSNRCHGLVMMLVNLSGIAFLKIKGADNRCIISGISKSEAINLKQNTI